MLRQPSTGKRVELEEAFIDALITMLRRPQ